MLIECKNCGAPLNVTERQKLARCSYCQRQNRVNQTRTVAQVTPPQWKPPVRWIPPAHFAQAGQQLVFRQKKVSIVQWLVLVLAVAALTMAVWWRTRPAGSPSPLWDGTTTLTCNANGKVNIEGITANVTQGPIVKAADNCEIRIVDSNLTGTSGIVAGNNARITIEGSTIVAKKTGLEAGINTHLTMVRSKVTGKSTGMRVGTNTSAKIDDSTIAGGVAIAGGINFRLQGNACHITGKTTSIEATMNGNIELQGCTLAGETQLGTNSQIKQK